MSSNTSANPTPPIEPQALRDLVAELDRLPHLPETGGDGYLSHIANALDRAALVEQAARDLSDAMGIQMGLHPGTDMAYPLEPETFLSRVYALREALAAKG